MQLKSLATLDALEEYLEALDAKGISFHDLFIHVNFPDEDSYCLQSDGNYVAEDGAVHLIIEKGSSR